MKGIWKYEHLLPSLDGSAKISLGEGATPLVKSRRIGPAMGMQNLYFKLESINPSGSYKDRFAALAVSDLIQKNARVCFATSSGNTGAALASYCAAAGIPCYITIVDGAPAGKLQQMQAYGAITMLIRDFGRDRAVTEEVMNRLTALACAHRSAVQISAYRHSPQGMAGVQTLAYELAEDLPQEKKQVFCPAGGGGLTLAVIEGFEAWKKRDASFSFPRINCVQPEGNDTIAGPLRKDEKHAASIARSSTRISGLQVPAVLDGDSVVVGCRKSGGQGYVVSDEEIYQCQRLLASEEGIFSEPAGAVALAGARAAWKEGRLSADEHTVCLVTGTGFKDPDSITEMAMRHCSRYFQTVDETFQFINSSL